MQSDQLKRREFIALLGAAAVAWSCPARAQESERLRRIGAVVSSSADDPLSQTVVGAFSQGLQELGWILGRNVQIDYRWAVDDDRIRRYATELVAFAPDVMLAFGSTAARAIQRETSTLPIVFVYASDPVGTGLVANLARPGGNATGFLSIENGMSTKWMELLKQIAPRVTRVAVIRDPTSIAGAGQFGAIQGAAPSFGVDVSSIDARDVRAIETAVLRFARRSNGGGLIVTTNRLARYHRDLIVGLATRHEIPTVYPNRYYVIAGGLISYGANFTDQLRQAAGYVDRILKGEKPADLPVQAPTKYELVINLKTAKTLGIKISDNLMSLADEVIE
jgi:putative ABC transport system substrate-binding protein